ncbi:MAG: hypothetical protein V3W41_21065 [Planctomycetota bacterium]
MTAVATDLRHDLEERFAAAVLESFRSRTQIDAYRICVEDQSRHKGRMATATSTVFGENWLGSTSLLIPAESARCIVLGSNGELEAINPSEAKSRPVRGTAVADVLGALVASAALRFGETFPGETKVNVGPPTVVIGDACSVCFPWGQHFESRLCFESVAGPFWAILRLSRMDS